MVRLPRVERGRRHEQRTVAFDNVNFRIKTRDDPRGQQRRRSEGIDGVAAEFVNPEDAIALGVDELDRDKIFPAVASQMAGRNILRVHNPGGRRGRLAAQRKSRTAGNDADASQLGKTKDDVACDAVGIRNVFLRRCERHQQQRRPIRGHRLLIRRRLEMRDAGRTDTGRPRTRALCRRQNGLERCRIDASGLELPHRCVDLVLGLGIKPAAKQRANELDVNRFVERRNFDALTQQCDAVIVLRRQDEDEPFEELLAPLTETVPLACEPILERRGPFDRETFEKVAAKQSQ
ncbi:hypothetical protein SO180_07060 [Bradyrhizobium sp. UFLA05-112]